MVFVIQPHAIACEIWHVHAPYFAASYTSCKQQLDQCIGWEWSSAYNMVRTSTREAGVRATYHTGWAWSSTTGLLPGLYSSRLPPLIRVRIWCQTSRVVVSLGERCT